MKKFIYWILISSFFISISAYTTENTRKTIKILSPKENDEFCNGDKIYVSWIISDTGEKKEPLENFRENNENKEETIFIEYATNHNKSWNEITKLKAESGSYLWTIPDVESDIYAIKIHFENDEDNFAISNEFKVSNNTNDESKYLRMNLGIGATAKFEDKLGANSIFMNLYFSKDNLFEIDKLSGSPFKKIGLDMKFYYGKTALNDTAIKSDTANTIRKTISDDNTKIISLGIFLRYNVLKNIFIAYNLDYRNKETGTAIIQNDTLISKSTASRFTTFNGLGIMCKLKTGIIMFDAGWFVGFDPTSAFNPDAINFFKNFNTFKFYVNLKEVKYGIKFGGEIYGQFANHREGAAPSTFMFYFAKDFSVTDIVKDILK